MKSNNRKHKTINVLGMLLLLLFLGHYGGTTLFSHSHIVDDHVIYHSHPYSANSHHTHTSFEYHAIRTLSTLLLLVVIVAAIHRSVYVGYVRRISHVISPFIARFFKTYPLRAPPIYC